MSVSKRKQVGASPLRQSCRGKSSTVHAARHATQWIEKEKGLRDSEAGQTEQCIGFSSELIEEATVQIVRAL